MRATPAFLLAVAAARGLLASAGQRRLEDAAAPADRAAGPKAPQEEAIVLAKAFRVAEGSNDRFAMIGPEPVADRRATQNILSFLGRVAFSIALVPAMWFTAREWYGAKVDSESSRSTHAFFWLLSTIVLTYANRSSVGTSPHVLLVVQMCFACVVFIIIWPVTGIEEIKQLRETVKWMPVTVTYVALSSMALLGFGHLQATTVMLGFGIAPIFTLLFETQLFGEEANAWRFAATGLAFAGSVLCVLGAVPYKPEPAVGVVGLGVFALLAATEKLYQRYRLFHKPIGVERAALVFVMNAGGVALLVCLLPLWSHEVAPFSARLDNWLDGRDPGDLQFVLISCVAALACSYSMISLASKLTATGVVVLQASCWALQLMVDRLFIGTYVAAPAQVGASFVFVAVFVALFE